MNWQNARTTHFLRSHPGSRRTALGAIVMGLVVLMAPTAQAARLKVAVLPLQPHIQAKAKSADWIERKFHRELRAQGATVLKGDVVTRAMKDAGAKDTLSCDDACLLKIGKALSVDRVLAPDLSLQKKEQSVGIVWLWTTRQMNVTNGKPWGEFVRMCMCHKDTWDRVAKNQVTRMLAYDPAKLLQLPPNAPRAKVSKGPTDEPGMVYVPAGPFIMGSTRGEFDEEPRHLVEMSAYYMDTYEVTNTQYNKCVAAGACRRQRYGRDKTLNQPKHPVVAVSWKNGANYCKWRGKHLPTEAQWEKAARGTDERFYPWGNDFDISWANQHHEADGYPTTAPVGSFPKNVSPYGAYDMAGNAWEWTADYWGPRYYRRSAKKDPTGPETGVKRVMRGGSWLYDVPFFVNAFNRSPGRPWVRKSAVGFRCAKSQ
jgi:sulfatase modifying factor 1